MIGKAAAAKGLAENKWTPIVIGGVVVGVGLLTYFGLIRPIMCKTGLATCKSDRRAKRIADRLKKKNAFNPNYYQASQLTITHGRAKEIADELYSAMWGADDEEKVFGLLSSAKNANNLSLVSKYYNMRKEESLVDELISNLDTEEELGRIEQIVNKY